MIKLPLAEKPHFVFQGEGRYTGQKMLLLRVQGCSLNCSFCDSKYTWKMPEKDQWIAVDELINDMEVDQIMITGGQPSLYPEQIADFVSTYDDVIRFHIEDDGSYNWTDHFDKYYNVYFAFSPKRDEKGLLQFATFNYSLDCDIKIVVKDASEVLEIAVWAEYFGISRKRIYIMPEGQTRKQILWTASFIAEKALELGFNFTLRNHIMLYDDKRMV